MYVCMKCLHVRTQYVTMLLFRSASQQHFLYRLILGSGKSGFSGVKSHYFFSGMDWVRFVLLTWNFCFSTYLYLAFVLSPHFHHSPLFLFPLLTYLISPYFTLLNLISFISLISPHPLTLLISPHFPSFSFFLISPYFPSLSSVPFSASRELISPPAAPTVGDSNGDTSNYDFYPEDDSEEVNTMTYAERKEFEGFDKILNRKKTV